jgi:hypothetical protein
MHFSEEIDTMPFILLLEIAPTGHAFSQGGEMHCLQIIGRAIPS